MQPSDTKGAVSMGNLIIGPAILVASIVGILVCRANNDGTKKALLGSLGVETIVGVAITGGIGFGLTMTIEGIAVAFRL